MEGIVLLWVEHFKECRLRVAVPTAALTEFVYLVEHKNGIFRTGFHHILNDAPRHGSHVGATMSANFSLIVHAA